MIPVLKRDSVWVGLVIGIVCPVALYGLLLLLYYFLETVGVFSEIGFAEDFRTRTLALVSICANLLIMQSYRKSHRHHETIRGLLIASMILVGIWFWKFGIKILQS
jgi:putative effector of murein hydrolase LrgA (UPF0299 family)